MAAPTWPKVERSTDTALSVLRSALSWLMISDGDNHEGDDLRALQLCIMQRRADRGATWQGAEVQGDLTVGAGGEGLPVGLDGEHRGWLVHQVEQRSDLAS